MSPVSRATWEGNSIMDLPVQAYVHLAARHACIDEGRGEALRSCLLSPVRLAVCTYSTDLTIPTLLFLFLKLQVEVPSFPMCRMRARMNPIIGI